MLRITRNWDPWRELDEIRNEMNRLFSGVRPSGGRTRPEEFPAINAWRSDHGLALTIELPGISPDQLEITVTANTLTVAGKPTVADEEAGTYHRRERPTEPFSRTIELPFEVDPDSAEALYERGVLVLKLFRPQQQLPKKVTVKSA